MTINYNPQEILWTDPTRFEDGSAFGASDFKAYELGVTHEAGGEPVPVFTLPTAFGVGQSPIPDVVKNDTTRLQYIALRTLDNYGQMSVWTPGLPVRFTSRPLAPTEFAAAYNG